ncbi:hypothetical protein GGQ84_000493 [Desulfitispora alkaliphila]|uniref:hypothetical protein n=1 Tax=Desulfitispora alkaliphila TaxID=622674 RepID=UPI003D242E7A
MNINITLPQEPVLQRFFSRELQQLVDKYKGISRERANKLEQLYQSTSQESYLTELDLDLALELAEEEYPVIALYLWLNEHDNPISIDTAKQYITDLEMEGYIETDDYLLKLRDADLEDYTRDTLIELLEDSYYVEEFFDKEQIVEMWIDNTTKEEAVDELMKIREPHVELLKLEFVEICILNNQAVLLAALKEF